jgi:hypothetical protein
MTVGHHIHERPAAKICAQAVWERTVDGQTYAGETMSSYQLLQKEHIRSSLPQRHCGAPFRSSHSLILIMSVLSEQKSLSLDQALCLKPLSYPQSLVVFLTQNGNKSSDSSLNREATQRRRFATQPPSRRNDANHSSLPTRP